jgi:CMP-N,N'-diacetyllegionaminic acid synthase
MNLKETAVQKRNDIVALIIGRGNNTLKDKNVLPVLGKPLLQWGAIAAKRSKYIGRYFISSDCDKILAAGRELEFQGIERPEYLALPTSQSSDVVRHACDIIDSESEASIVVVIHANVGTITTEMIDECIELLLSNDRLSSVVPSHTKDEYHPLRGKKINEYGELVPFVDTQAKVSANRQDLEKCLFFDHSFWVLDKEKGINCENGQYPWPVMGNHILPYITEGCFDVHDLDDIQTTEEWIKANGILALYQNEGII